MAKKPKDIKLLYLDIETAPKVAYVWGMWKETVGLNQLKSDGYVLCACARWYDTKQTQTYALWDYKSYSKHPEDDKELCQALWELLDEADIIVAHNGLKFDLPTLNARFAIHGLPPPSNYVIVDTLKIAKSKFRFTSNRLDALGMFLGVGRKVDTGGFDLWAQVLAQDESAQRKMIKYCKQDVALLEQVYLKLRAWDATPPTVGLYLNADRPVCNVCGSAHVIKRGYDYTRHFTYSRYKCVDCGHNMRDKKRIGSKATLVSQ